MAVSDADAVGRAIDPLRCDHFEGVTEGDDALLSVPLAPLPLELFDQLTPDPICVAALGGETDDFGATVLGVRDSLR